MPARRCHCSRKHNDEWPQDPLKSSKVLGKPCEWRLTLQQQQPLRARCLVFSAHRLCVAARRVLAKEFQDAGHARRLVLGT